MKTLENASDKIKWWYKLYQLSGDYTLYAVYKNPSYAKLQAYDAVKRRLHYDENVKSHEVWKILTHNSMTFTCATVYTSIYGNSIFRVETAYNTYECLV